MTARIVSGYCKIFILNYTKYSINQVVVNSSLYAGQVLLARRDDQKIIGFMLSIVWHKIRTPFTIKKSVLKGKKSVKKCNNGSWRGVLI